MLTLARDLRMTPREVLTRHTARELVEWQAYYEIEPRGDARMDWLFGSLWHLIMGALRDPKGHDKLPKIEELAAGLRGEMRVDTRYKPPEGDALIAKVRGVMNAIGAELADA